MNGPRSKPVRGGDVQADMVAIPARDAPASATCLPNSFSKITSKVKRRRRAGAVPMACEVVGDGGMVTGSPP